MEQAERLTGHTDWGDLAFLKGLEAYCNTVNNDAQIRSAIVPELREQILYLLGQRLQLYRDRSTYSEIPEQEIARPVIITGLPRTGSTLLHGLMAQDLRARSIATWEHQEISPPARSESYQNDPRIRRARLRLADVPPEVLRIHEVGATLPDECNFVTAMAFQSVNLVSRFYKSAYMEWYLQADDAPAYEMHRHALQHMQAFCSRDWWVLKSPPHIFHLARIFKTYPNARIIFLHRDPGVTIPSIVNLFAGGQRRTYEPLDTHRTGREVLGWWREGMTRALEFRSGSVHRAQFHDVHYTSLSAAPMETVEAIYDWLGEDLVPEAVSAMERFLVEHPKNKYGQHVYSAEDYGLDAQSIRDVFADYIKTFDVATA